MDKIGADFFQCLKDIVDRLGAKPVAIQLPIGAESQFKGLVDLVKMKGVIWNDESLGAKYGASPEQVGAMNERVVTLAAAEGLAYRLDRYRVNVIADRSAATCKASCILSPRNTRPTSDFASKCPLSISRTNRGRSRSPCTPA